MNCNHHHEIIAELIAAAVTNPTAPAENGEALLRHVRDTVLAADLSDPETIRRVYPVAARLIEERGGGINVGLAKAEIAGEVRGQTP
jgi:hypothetical protein